MLITNKDVVKFLHGYFEFRAKWPNPGKGMFPALWLYAALGSGGPKPTAEIDIVEIFGSVGGTFTSSIHGPANVTVGTDPGDTTGYHTYGLDWQPTYLRFYKDRVLLYEVTGSNAAWFDTYMGIRINFAMNASWFSAGNISDGSTPSPMNMVVDSVNVWNRPPF